MRCAILIALLLAGCTKHEYLRGECLIDVAEPLKVMYVVKGSTNAFVWCQVTKDLPTCNVWGKVPFGWVTIADEQHYVKVACP